MLVNRSMGLTGTAELGAVYVIGDDLRFQIDDRQQSEIAVAVLVLNRMLHLGRCPRCVIRNTNPPASAFAASMQQCRWPTAPSASAMNAVSCFCRSQSA